MHLLKALLLSVAAAFAVYAAPVADPTITTSAIVNVSRTHAHTLSRPILPRGTTSDSPFWSAIWDALLHPKPKQSKRAEPIATSPATAYAVPTTDLTDTLSYIESVSRTQTTTLSQPILPRNPQILDYFRALYSGATDPLRNTIPYRRAEPSMTSSSDVDLAATPSHGKRVILEAPSMSAGSTRAKSLITSAPELPPHLVDRVTKERAVRDAAANFRAKLVRTPIISPLRDYAEALLAKSGDLHAEFQPLMRRLEQLNSTDVDLDESDGSPTGAEASTLLTVVKRKEMSEMESIPVSVDSRWDKAFQEWREQQQRATDGKKKDKESDKKKGEELDPKKDKWAVMKAMGRLFNKTRAFTEECDTFCDVGDKDPKFKKASAIIRGECKFWAELVDGFESKHGRIGEDGEPKKEKDGKDGKGKRDTHGSWTDYHAFFGTCRNDKDLRAELECWAKTLDTPYAPGKPEYITRLTDHSLLPKVVHSMTANWVKSRALNMTDLETRVLMFRNAKDLLAESKRIDKRWNPLDCMWHLFNQQTSKWNPF